MPPYYLINPAGRVVVFDRENDFKDYAQMPGFTLPNKEQIDSFVKQRINTINAMKSQQTGEGVYMATVSQGGKDGYGVASAKLISKLTEMGVNISTYYNHQKIGLLFHSPYTMAKMETPIKIIFTMFESDKIPDDWLPYLKEADKVLVPSDWCKAVFAKSGIAAEVVPLGYDDSVFTYKKHTNKRKARKTFTFLHYNAFNIRKGFLEVFKAFTEEFDTSEPVELVLKTTLNCIPAAIPINPSQYPNIKIITGAINDTDLAELNQNADCFLFPSRGEGFGMTPLEAMACGTPAIVPNAHGISHYFDTDYMYEVKVKETCPAIYSRYKGQDVGNMVICDIDDLRKQMRYVYEHQDEAIEKGRVASKYVQNWTWAKTAAQLKGIFENESTKPVEKKPLGNILKVETVI